MAEHTPGPWIWNDDPELAVYAKPLTGIALIFRYGDVEMGDSSPSDCEAEANARLMAAAPEMLAVLEKIRRDAIAESGRVLPGTMLEMQGVINKAKGLE